jgi:hypothetical protein
MKDIKEVLHLYLYCQCQLQGDDHVKTFTLTTYNLNYYRAWISEIRPILKRLSDMSEEDAISIAEILGGASHLTRDSQIHQVKELLTDIHHKQTNVPGYRWMMLTVFLLKKGYWLFGDEAFDQGLIIDSKTLK